MSFFDEADEPQPTPRTETRRSRSAGRPPRGSGRPPGGSGRPPRNHHQQEVQTRRMIAVGVIVVIVIALALLIKGCESSATTNSLKNYNANVYRLVGASVTNGQNVLQALTSGSLSTLNLGGEVQAAQTQLHQAEELHAPSQMSSAQRALVTVMQLREDGISTIAKYVQQAASKSTSKDAVSEIAAGTSQLYSSDVIYKTIVGPDLAKALHAASISVGTNPGDQQINGGQIVTDLGWLNPTWIADKIGAQLSTTAANANNDQPGLHGHSLNSVSVDGTELTPGVTNTLPAGTQTFTLNLTNGGDFTEYDVECKVTVEGLSDVGEATVAETTSNETTNCTVKLPTPLTKGTWTVTAEVAAVPGETNTKNNFLTYTIVVN